MELGVILTGGAAILSNQTNVDPVKDYFDVLP